MVDPVRDWEPKQYFLALELGNWEEPDWKEVTKEQYVKAEHTAGFRSKFGWNHIATAGFTSGSVCGRVEY